MVKLTVKQQRFADEYLISGNATEAAVIAGYSEKTARVIATENLTKPAIKSYIEIRLKEMQSEKVADQQEVMEFLTSVLRGQARGTALVGEGMGSQTVEQVLPSVGEKVRAAEQIGKRYAMWTEKHQVDSETLVKFEYDFGDEDEND